MNISSERPNCQDCGNKAKRECQHSRCRTCCKSRGFFCPTHVRSTWVPVSRRHRNHRLSLLPPPSFLHLQGLGGRNYQSFPAEISTVANFRRVQVTSGDNEVDEAAYQTSVMIGGHLFKGILYYQGGPSSASPGGGGEGSSAVAGMTAPGGFCGGANPPPPPPPSYSSNPNITHDDHNNYTSFNASLLRPGMQFFPHPKP